VRGDKSFFPARASLVLRGGISFDFGHTTLYKFLQNFYPFMDAMKWLHHSKKSSHKPGNPALSNKQEDYRGEGL
jgi:hypothetical protein